MQTKQLTFRDYTLRDTRTYLFTAFFVAGNIVLPQLCHLIPNGGHTWLPIYFFTLIGSYLYGWRVGVLVALLSPVINSLLFGMPHVSALAPITVKSVALALAAGIAAHRWRRVNILTISAVVLAYQIVGGLFEWAYTASFAAALQDFRIGLPGILVQIFGGTLLIYLLARQKAEN